MLPMPESNGRARRCAADFLTAIDHDSTMTARRPASA
jgi:hypothetical protein